MPRDVRSHHRPRSHRITGLKSPVQRGRYGARFPAGRCGNAAPDCSGPDIKLVFFDGCSYRKYLVLHGLYNRLGHARQRAFAGDTSVDWIDILRKARGGDVRSQKIVLETLEKIAKRAARHMSGDYAQEVIDATIDTVCRNNFDFSGWDSRVSEFSAYASGIVKNILSTVCRRAVLRALRQVSIGDLGEDAPIFREEPNQERAVYARQIAPCLETAKKELRDKFPDSFEIFYLFFENYQTYRQIALRTQLKVGDVGDRLRTAKQRFYRIFRELGGQCQVIYQEMLLLSTFGGRSQRRAR